MSFHNLNTFYPIIYEYFCYIFAFLYLTSFENSHTSFLLLFCVFLPFGEKTCVITQTWRACQLYKTLQTEKYIFLLLVNLLFGCQVDDLEKGRREINILEDSLDKIILERKEMGFIGNGYRDRKNTNCFINSN